LLKPRPSWLGLLLFPEGRLALSERW